MKEKLRSDFLSRQKMVQDDFEVYYYSDPNGVRVAPHLHENYEFQLLLEGDVQCVVNGSTFELKPRDLVIIPPGSRHFNKVSHDQPYRRFIVWFSAGFLNRLTSLSSDFGYFQKDMEENRYVWNLDMVSFQNLQSDLIRLLETMRYQNFGRQTAMSLDLADLILSVNRILWQQDHPYIQKEEKNLNARILEFITTHLDENLSLERLAGEFFVSKYYISHLFTSEFGISLHQFVIKKRLDQVRNALVTGQNLSRAIEQAGFKNYSSFFRAFQKEYGMSPTEYRKKWSLESDPGSS